MRTELFLIWRWWSDRQLNGWCQWQEGVLCCIWNINVCGMTSWCYIRGSNCDFLRDAVMVLVLRRIKNPAVWPGETCTRCQDEVSARHPTLVGVSYGQFLDIAWKIVFNGKVDLLVSAPVRTLEQCKRLIKHTLWLVVRKFNRLSITWNNSGY